MKYILLFFLLFQQIFAQMINYKITTKNFSHVTDQKIKILDSKLLVFKKKNEIPFYEISDIEYENGFLYFISDEGYLYRFFIDFNQNKIKSLEYLDAYILKNKKGKRLKKKKRDAEGITLYKENLLVSFERQNRIIMYSKNGLKIKKVKIHKDLQDKDNYINNNKGLEAVAYNDKYGVVTAPELPLRTADSKYHALYSDDKVFKFPFKGNIVSLEFIDDETILILLRDFNYLLNIRVSSLIKLHLNECDENRLCKSEVLAKLDSKNGWNIDNFEGLTMVGKNKFLMISDDNKNIFQKTLLVLFEIKD